MAQRQLAPTEEFAFPKGVLIDTGREHSCLSIKWQRWKEVYMNSLSKDLTLDPQVKPFPCEYQVGYQLHPGLHVRDVKS